MDLHAEPSTGPNPLAHRSAGIEPLRLVILGGVGEFGMNMACYEAEGERLVVDCGAMFPEAEMLGVDLVIPDVTHITEKPDMLKGFVLTHAHDDHIGALAYVFRQVRAPVYGTPMSLAFLETRLEEEGINDVEMIPLEYRRPVRIGEAFEVEAICVTHSVPNSAALAIRTSAGVIVHTGDYKIDYSPVTGEPFDFHRLSQLGEEGVLALVGDSTNAHVEGATRSERWVLGALEPIFGSSQGTIFATTFSTSIHRIQVLMDLAVEFDRRILIAGRSMERSIAIASDLGYLSVPHNDLVSLNDYHYLPPDRRLVIATGSQGEPMSVMSRLALGEYRQMDVEEDDAVVLSARIIPGHERAVSRMLNHFCRKGARVYSSESHLVHTSGHAFAEEMKAMIAMVRPRYLIPVHGEARQQMAHREIAIGMGFPPDRVFVLDQGEILELHLDGVRRNGFAAVGRVLVDGKTIGETGEVVLRDRQHLSEDGMIIAILNVDQKTGELLNEPEIVTRGFVYVDESESIIADLKGIVRKSFEACSPEAREDPGILNAELRSALRKHIRRTYDRFPVILPVVQEI